MEGVKRVIDRLIAGRKALGLDQSQLSKRMGTAQSTISELESGRRVPRLDTVLRYAWAAEVNLFSCDDECSSLPSQMLRSGIRTQARERAHWTGLLNDLRGQVGSRDETFQALLVLCAVEDGEGHDAVKISDIYRILSGVRL